MFKIESNIEDVKKSIQKTLTNSIKFDQALREGALSAVALISDRVQQRGERADGSKMVTSSKEKIGAYSKPYAKQREKKGLQTSIIDQTYSGDMMGDFVPAPEGANSYIVGFRGQLSSDKADWNERKFGKIFQLSERETKLVQGIITKRLNASSNK